VSPRCNAPFVPALFPVRVSAWRAELTLSVNSTRNTYGVNGSREPLACGAPASTICCHSRLYRALTPRYRVMPQQSAKQAFASRASAIPSAKEHLSALHALLLQSRAPAMKEALRRLTLFGGSDAPAHVEGPTGSGKSLAFHLLCDTSARRLRPRNSIMLSTLDPSLAYAELFGHVRGAFTGSVGERPGLLRMNEGGTLLLDEINSATPSIQGQLLAFVEHRLVRSLGSDVGDTVDCRIVSASNAPLEAAVSQDRFRADLCHRLCARQVRLPGLSERSEDIPDIVEWMAERYYATRPEDTPRSPLHPELFDVMRAHPWRGNLRELQSYIESLIDLSPDGSEITPTQFYAERDQARGSANADIPEVETYHRTMAFAEVQLCLERNGGNKRKAARELDVRPEALYASLRDRKALRLRGPRR